MKPPESIAAMLERIGAKLEDATYSCRACRDLGLLLREKQPDGHPAPSLYARPCPECEPGRRYAASWAIRGRDATREARQNEEPPF